jgi:hypothetical protein
LPGRSQACGDLLRPVAAHAAASLRGTKTVIFEDVELNPDLLITRGRVARIKDGCGVELRVKHGSVWITQEHSTQDVVLEAGDSFRISHNGVTLVSTCGSRTVFASVSIKRRPAGTSALCAPVATRR